MIFFTRALYEGVQDESGWSRRAERTWTRNSEIYQAYLFAITPLLPRSFVRLCRGTLHDSVIESVAQSTGRLTLFVDTRGSMGRFSGGRLQLTFTGVRRRIPVRGLVGEWWLYE